MELYDHLKSISENIISGKFVNEASISQGIVLRLLQALGWDIHNTEIVSPEYSLGGRRVDFALCYPPKKPIIFIEVKQTGQADSAEKQLFEYAFHTGVPLAILTDGREWQFFLPGEQGLYQERRVYKLDILERSLEESVERFNRYLSHDQISNGKAIENARLDYKDITKEREINEAMPKAWQKLIEEGDELLLELIADKAESICGYKPNLDKVSDFLKERFTSIPVPITNMTTQPSNAFPQTNQPKPSIIQRGTLGFKYKGAEYSARNSRDMMKQFLVLFAKEDKSFLNRFALNSRHGKKRQYLAKDKFDLYKGRPDLCESQSVELFPGYWLGLNYSKDGIEKIIKLACETANVKFGKDLILKA